MIVFTARIIVKDKRPTWVNVILYIVSVMIFVAMIVSIIAASGRWSGRASGVYADGDTDGRCYAIDTTQTPLIASNQRMSVSSDLAIETRREGHVISQTYVSPSRMTSPKGKTGTDQHAR
jgi:hypothetical protein